MFRPGLLSSIMIYGHPSCEYEYRQITDDWQPPSNCWPSLSTMPLPVACIGCVLVATCSPRGMLYMRPSHDCVLPSFFCPRLDPPEQVYTSTTALRLPLSTPILNFIDFIAYLHLFVGQLSQSSPCLTMPCNTEVRVTPYGIPYVVEFANVSIWPRPPLLHPDGGHHWQPSDLA